MNKETLAKAIKELKEKGKKRNFVQSYDLIINFKNLDLKKSEEQLDLFVQLHYPLGKKVKICALIGPESENESKAADNIVLVDDFQKYREKKEARRLAKGFDFFVAQANLMPKIATTFGRVFGPKGKMPSPKAGCIVPPKTNLKALCDKLQKIVRISVKTAPMLQCALGTEDMKDEEVIDNALTVYNTVVHSISKEKIRSAYLKLTMSKPVKLM